jgi:predicted CoA-substrate-specific enzyme activase
MQYYLGIDVGSVSTKLAVLDSKQKLMAYVYLPTRGEPVNAVNEGIVRIQRQIPEYPSSSRMTTVTGSGRHLVASLVSADFIKNEVTAQAAASLHYFPYTRTVIEIGGQDSKIILIRDGLMIDFGMNTVCAAGTGSFLDHQAQRLGLCINEFGELAVKSQSPVKINGRCTVFAESDMIHQQQSGNSLEDIVYGLCQALAHNYLTGVAAGKDIQSPIVFQGGLAYNRGIVRALEEAMGTKLTIPQHPELMGAIGAALLAQIELPHKKATQVLEE